MMSVSQSLANAYMASERDKRCESNGGHFYGKVSNWHRRYYFGSGDLYWIRFQVCKECEKRKTEQKWEEPTEGEIE